ncbi:unnamed protein product [Rhizoctonia solani]|uniref:Uncharacterized protein n=1 Tax=Rhizoctonia solani TaxID=456999 RepID=A0A8H2Y2R3_9AGAM|nr:unnamed protein product [Rhizoctonia solani]
MSAAPPVSSPFAQLPARGEHLAVHTKMDAIHPNQSLPSTGESIDEVQLNLDAQTDELSMDGDRVQVDELEEDTNEDLQHPFGPDSPLNGEHVNGEPGPAETSQLAGQVHEQNVATAVGLEQMASMEEPTEELPQTEIEIGSILSKTDAILPAEALGTTAAIDSGDYVSLEEQDNLEISEGEDFGFPVPLTEQEISVITQSFAPDAGEMMANPSEQQPSEQDSNQPEIQITDSESVVVPEPVVESHQEIDAPPLRRMDDDTIPVTTHSKDSIIEILQDAPSTTVDEVIQLATAEEQAPQENEPAASTEIVPEQVDMEVDIQDVIQPEELAASAPVMVDLEHIEVLEPTEVEGDTVMEQLQVVIEQDGEPTTDATAEDSGDHQPNQSVQEGPIPTVLDESAASDPALDNPVTTSGDAAGPIVTVVEESTTITEHTSVGQTEQSGPSTVDPAPVAIMGTTATSIVATLISDDPVVPDLVIPTADPGEMETDHVERAAKVQREQDATIQTTEDETQATLVESVATANDTVVTDDATLVESVATANDTVVTDDVPDPTAPKDSDSPLRHATSQSESQSQSQSQSHPDLVVPPPAGPIDSPITQDREGEIPEESSESTKAQYQVSTDQPETSGTGPSNRQTPEWEGFAALDGDHAPDSPEPEPSSEPSEYPDVVTAESPVNPTSASTDKAKEPSNSPTAPAPRPKKKKPKLIMEVVIPIARDKPKVVQKTKTVKKRQPGQPPNATKSTKTPAPSTPKLPAASSSSPTRRSSSEGTPSPVKSETSKSAPRMKKPVAKRPRLSSSHKRAKKAVASGSSTGTRSVHVAHAAKLEVVIPRKPRPSVLKGVGSTPSGNNVKFASVSPATRKRKAESEPDEDEDEEETDADADGETDDDYEDVEEEPNVKVEVVIDEDEDEEETDADADGETDDDYEDVEEEPNVKVEVVIPPRKRQKKTKAFTKGRISPIKRPRRSTEARKTPAKTPEILSKSPRSAHKRRRLRR